VKNGLKKWNRTWKIQLIEHSNPNWDDLYPSMPALSLLDCPLSRAMTEGGGSGLPGNDVVMPAQAGIQYAVSARSGNALIAMAVSTGLPACAGNDGRKDKRPRTRVRSGAVVACQAVRRGGAGNGADQSFLSGFLGPLEGGAQDVAQRGARIGGSRIGAIASFSSAISRALMETWTLWVRRSNWVTRASTFWPTAKRSGRCSARSRARSARLG